jgi:hypothetical protein
VGADAQRVDPLRRLQSGATVTDDLEVMAAMAHGGSAVLNLLGIAYNLRKRNGFDVLIHSAGLVYHLISVRKHARDVHTE